MDHSPTCSSVHWFFQVKKYWSEYPLPSKEDLTNKGIKPGSPELQADSLQSEKFGVSRCKLLCGGWIESKVQLCSTGDYTKYSVKTQMGKESEKD